MVSAKHCGETDGKHHKIHALRRPGSLLRAHGLGSAMGNTDRRTNLWAGGKRKPGDAFVEVRPKKDWGGNNAWDIRRLMRGRHL